MSEKIHHVRFEEWWTEDQYKAYFWSQVEKTNCCWIWRGKINSAGYGRTPFYHNFQQAHQVAYAIIFGMFATSKTSNWVLHSCDVKICVNPAHLRLGSPQDNIKDTSDRRRWANQKNSIQFCNCEKGVHTP